MTDEQPLPPGLPDCMFPHRRSACPAPPSRQQVILYAGMTDKQRELNQQLRDRTLNVRRRMGGGCCL